MYPSRLVITQKCREWQEWQGWKFGPLSHNHHGKNITKTFIKIIQVKANRRRVQGNIHKRVWGFVMIWEADIYSRTAGKDGHPALERLTGDTIDISECLKFEFYDLVWFLNNHSDDTKPMLVRWLCVSHRVGSALCYWIIIEKGKVLYRTTVQHLAAEEPRYPDVQEWIRDYLGSMEDALGSGEFGNSLDVYDSFINDDK